MPPARMRAPEIPEWAHELGRHVAVRVSGGNWDAAINVVMAVRKERLRLAGQLSYQEKLAMGVHEILDERTANRCSDEGHLYVRSLIGLTPHNLFSWPNVGPGTVKRIQIALGKIGLALKGTEVVEDGTEDEG